MSDQGNDQNDSFGDDYWQYNPQNDPYHQQAPLGSSMDQPGPPAPGFVPASVQVQQPAANAQAPNPQTSHPRQRKRNNTVLWIIGAVVLGVALGVGIGFLVPHLLTSGGSSTESQSTTSSQTQSTQQSTDQPTDQQTTVRENQPDPTGGVTTSERPASGPTESPGPNGTVVPVHEWLSAQAKVSAEKGLNVRKGPGVDYPVVTAIANKESLTITAYNSCSQNSRWYYVTYAGTKGWVSADYVTITDSFEGC